MTPPANAPTDAPRCPRRAARAASASAAAALQRLTARQFAAEPFRLFFPVATLAGLIGVALWPLMIAGWMTDYPGERHARLMIHGFFGGFMLGFLGTSLPRFLEVAPLRRRETFPLLALAIVGIVAHSVGATRAGDRLFALQFLSLPFLLVPRWFARRDLPPPGFVLLPLAIAAGIGGMILLHGAADSEGGQRLLLGKLLAYRGFVLLAILGAGGFLLPRFLGVGPRRKIAAAPAPGPEWLRATMFATVVGLATLATYVLEAFGSPRLAATLRAALVVGYCVREIPFERLRWTGNGAQWFLVVGLACLPLGILASGWLPAWRVGFSHLELVGGFGLITAGVATRVVLGHTGQRALLERFHGWLTTAGLFLVVGMLTRVFADLVPSSMISHYLYGALCWIIGMVIWAVCVLRHVLKPDPEP